MRKRNVLRKNPGGTADHAFDASDHRLNTLSGQFLVGIALLRRDSHFLCETLQRKRRRVVAGDFNGNRRFEQFRRLHAVNRFQTRDFQFALRQRSGFVEHETADFGGEFQMRHVLDEDSETRGRGNRRDHGGRSRKNHGAGTCDDHERNHPVHIAVGEPPGERRKHENRRRVEPGVLVDDAHHRCLARFGGENHLFDLAERGIVADLRHLDVDRAGKVHGSGINFIARALVDRKRFAGDRRLVDRALSLDDDAVDREVFARADIDDVAQLKIKHFRFDEVAVDQLARGVRRQTDQVFNGTLSARRGARFDDDCNQQEECDDSGLAENSARERRKQGHRDELVHVDASGAEVLDCRPDNRERKNDCTEHGTEFGGEFLRGEKPLKQEGIQYQETAGDGESGAAHGTGVSDPLPHRLSANADRGVLVVMIMVMSAAAAHFFASSFFSSASFFSLAVSGSGFSLRRSSWRPLPMELTMNLSLTFPIASAIT